MLDSFASVALVKTSEDLPAACVRCGRRGATVVDLSSEGEGAPDSQRVRLIRPAATGTVRHTRAVAAPARVGGAPNSANSEQRSEPTIEVWCARWLLIDADC